MSGDPLHGRTAELEAIAGALDAVASGEPRLLTVRGEAGIGKTRLLAELRGRAAAQRFVVLEGRATELEQRTAAGADRRRARAAVARARRPRPAGPAAARAAGVRVGRGAGPRRRRGERRALATAPRAWRAARVDRRRAPALLLIDDVHWADPATLELLEHLIRRPPAESLLIALGLRPGARGRAPTRRAARRRRRRARRAGSAPAGSRRRRAAARADRRRRRARALLRAVGRQPVAAATSSHARAAGTRSRAASSPRSPARSHALPDDARALVEGAAIAGDPFDVRPRGARRGARRAPPR